MMISYANLPFEQMIEKQRQYGLDYEFFFRQKMMGLAPLNLDWDTKRQAKWGLKKLRNSKYNKGHFQILWRKSVSRKGWHLTFFKDGRQLFLPMEKVLRVRKIYKDCYNRLFCDKKRAKAGLCISILFNSKNGRTATAWRDLKQLKI